MTTKNWNDIDIGGLSMETPCDTPEGTQCQRHERISSQDLSVIVLEQNKIINVKIENLTSRQEFTGVVLDISPGGAKILTTGVCQNPDVLRISFKVGKRQILCRAKVAWSKNEKQGLFAGVQFITPDATDVDFIKSLLAAKHLK